MNNAWIGLIILVGGVLILVLAGDGNVGGMDQGKFAGILVGIALLILIAGSGMLGYRGHFPKALKDASIWLAVLLGLITIYSFRHEFNVLGSRVMGELMPGSFNTGYQNGRGESVVEIAKSTNGHFETDVTINGATVRMLVDTGASTVSLTHKDAKRVGFDTSKLVYNTPVNTANGQKMSASAKLNEVAIGHIRIPRVWTHISKPGSMDQSLLGMSFLSKLKSYEVRNGVLILRR